MPETQKPLQSAVFLLKQITTVNPATKKPLLDANVLTAHQRRICVRYMLLEHKYTEHEMAEVLGVSRSAIARDKAQIRKQNSWMLDEVDERRIAVEIMETARFSATRLHKQGKHYEAFQVLRQMKEELQDLGYLYKEPQKFEGQMTLLEALKLAKPEGQIIPVAARTVAPEDEKYLRDRAGGNGVPQAAAS